MAFQSCFEMVSDDKQNHHAEQQPGSDNPHLAQFGVTLRISSFFGLPQFAYRLHKRGISARQAVLPSIAKLNLLGRLQAAGGGRGWTFLFRILGGGFTCIERIVSVGTVSQQIAT